MRAPMRGLAAGCTAAALTVLVASRPAAAHGVTFAIAGAPFVGVHGGVVGQTRIGGSPLPLVDLDANFGRVGVHAEGVPYARTGRYGDALDTSRSTVQGGVATLRLFTSRTLAFGVGYGVIATTTDRIAPPGSFTSFADGVRLELHEGLDLSPAGRLELTFGGMPQLHGTMHVYPGIPGALDRYDPLAGAQIDAEARYLVRSRGPVSLGYGIRYVNATLVYARSAATAERNAGLLPFVQLNFRL